MKKMGMFESPPPSPPQTLKKNSPLARVKGEEFGKQVASVGAGIRVQLLHGHRVGVGDFVVDEVANCLIAHLM